MPFVLSLLFGCSSKENRFDVDISNIDVNIKIHRFEKDIMSLDHDDYDASLQKLEQKYPKFYQLYIENILEIGKLEDNFYQPQLQGFLLFDGTKALYDDVINLYDDLSDVEHELTQAFKYYKYHFQDRNPPKIVSYISEYVFGNVTADNVLGIGLDMYLGENYQYYPFLGIPKYKFRKFRKEYLVPLSVKAFLQGEYLEDDMTSKELLSKMIYHGKILYCMDAMLPHTPDSFKIGYTRHQLEWCKKSETGIWAYFIDQDLLFEKDYKKYHKYLSDGPFTTGLPRESGPMIAVWVGWQIVRAYMKKNSDIALPNLMGDPDYSGRSILEKSKYKPK